MTKLTKKGKITIAVSVIAAIVLIFSITMFSLWATVEVAARQVNYATLQKKMGDTFIVPSGLDDDIAIGYVTDKTCTIYFPRAEEGSKHRYGKYTNLTVRYKYATGYAIDLTPKDVFARITASKDSDIATWIDGQNFDVQKVDGVDIYYKRSNAETVSGGIREDMEILFVLDSALYKIQASSIDVDARQKTDDYARYLFDKFHIVKSDGLN